MDEKRFDELAMMVAEETTPGDEGITPADESMPRRAALGVVGGLAGLAALAASANSASAHPGQAGLLTRVRQVVDSVSVPAQRDRVLSLVCPAPPSGQRVFVMGGGYNHTSNSPNFVISTSAPNTTRSWVVVGHNHTSAPVTLGGYAICAYFRA